MTAQDRCPVCRGRLGREVVAQDVNRRVSAEEFVYARCRQCRTLVLTNVPGDLHRYYPPEYYASADDAGGRETGATEAYKVDLLERYLAVAPARILEVGAGSGGFVSVARGRGHSVVVVDVDDAAARVLRERFGVDTVIDADTAGAIGRAGTFDAVVMWHSLEHIPEPLTVVDAAARALRPEGVLVVATPSPDATQYRLLGRRWTHLDAPRHVVLFPPATLAAALGQHGLQVETVTFADPGSRGWNSFGWQVSLARLSSEPRRSELLRRTGRLVEMVLRPVERRGWRGSCYTVVARRAA